MKEIFSNRKFQIAEFVLLGLSSAGLLIGGQSAEGLSSVITSISAALAAVFGVAALVRSLLNKENKEEDKGEE